MNAPAVAATAQPTADIHLAARVVEQQLNAQYMVSAFFSHHQQQQQQQQLSSISSDPNLNTVPSTISNSSSNFLQAQKDSQLLFNEQFNLQNHLSQAASPQMSNSAKTPFMLPVMLLSMPSTSDSTTAAYMLNHHQQQQHQQQQQQNHLQQQQQRKSIPSTEAITSAQTPSKEQQRTAAMQFPLAKGITSQTPPESSSGILQLPAVPKCSICSADSTGIHFGVEACAACSAFFRRTVVLNKNYVCPKDGKCPFNHDSPTGQKCRSCRFKKCLEVGMDRNAVQHRRDAIGKYSAAVKRECSSPTGISEVNFTNQQSDQALSPPTPKSPRLSIPQLTVIDELTEQYSLLNQRRKIFYCNSSVAALFENDELVGPDDIYMEFHELDNFGDCMFQLYRVEPRLCVEFIDKNRFLAGLPSHEKKKILTNFVLHFQAVEEPYLTWKFGGAECNRFWVMPNRTYIDFSRTEHYFDQNKAIMKELNLDKKSAIKLFQPSFAHAMETIGTKMANINLSRREMVCLVGFVLFDPTIEGIDLKTQESLQHVRNLLLKEMMAFYESEGDDAELRLANVILVMSGIKVHAQKTRENMQMLKFFDIIPRDRLFDEICGLNGNDTKVERSVATPSSSTTTTTTTPIGSIYDGANE
jgi:hypothetical protein